MATLAAATSQPAPSLSQSTKPLAWWAIALLGVLAVAVYANSMLNEFTYDDRTIIKENPSVLNLEWTHIWQDNYWPRNEGILPDTLYRPLTMWTYLANEAITPGTPWPYHLVNIFLHALVTILVCHLAWRLIADRRVALVAGALFAVHPIHVEAVANTVGRAELLGALWSMLALLVYLPKTPLKFEGKLTHRSWFHGVLVAVCFFAAILSKETPAALLLAFPMLDAWRFFNATPENRPSWWRWFTRQAVTYYLPLAVTFGVYLKMRITACGLMADTHTIHHIVNPLVEATPAQRIITPFMLLAKYIWIMCWPTHLSADYSAPSLMPTANPMYSTKFQPPAALGMMILGLAIFFAIRKWRKIPAFLLLVALFLSSYLLVSNIIRIGTIFGERLFYWPSVFFLLMVAWALVAGYQKMQAALPQTPRWALPVAGLFMLAIPVFFMSRISNVRNTDWADNLTLAISTARDNPNSGKACSWAGATLVLSTNPEQVAFGKALVERAIELSPDYPSARWELAKFYGLRHDVGHSAVCVAAAARLDPGTHLTRLAIPSLIAEMRTKPAETYMPIIEQNAKDHPDDPAAYLALAFGYHAQKEYDNAAANARKAIDMSKFVRKDGFDQFHEAGAELAVIRFESGRKKEGVDEFRIYANYLKNSLDAQVTFASMLLELDPKTYPQMLAEADFHIRVASAIDPAGEKPRALRSKFNQVIKQFSHDVAAASAAPTGKDSQPLGVQP